MLGRRTDRPDVAAAREAMVETIRAELAWYGDGDGRHELDPRVAEAMSRVPRERFVPADLAAKAYENRPLPIGHAQTISQPLIVAIMTQLLRLEPGSRVLEVGTGSGYQTALLAELAGEVVSIEVVEALATEARARLEELGNRNVELLCGDGAAGCPEKGPFDAILVTAAADALPPALIEQLRPGGRMVVPLGGHAATQELALVEKEPTGAVRERRLLPVAFVPLTGGRPAGDRSA
jgi:protein-L-isoaspartate(D-aspartate) O-methyltransferase